MSVIRPGDILIHIGGQVLDATVDPPVGLEGAWVRLETLSGVALQTATSDSQGRFIFASLQEGQYQIQWRVEGRPVPTPRVIDVPSITGEYDLRFE